jgi:hypothetical protein
MGEMDDIVFFLLLYWLQKRIEKKTRANNARLKKKLIEERIQMKKLNQ